MINRFIEASLKNRVLVVVAYLGLALWGYWALGATPIDAIPDLSDNQVIVFTDWNGHSPQEVEDQVTYPLTVNLQGLAGVRVVRSQSAFGFSMIYVVFEDNVDLYFARSRVLERMSLVTKTLPAGVTPTLGPDATGVGHVFWYTVESPTLSLRELRSIQDWFIRYQLNAVSGVAEVASVGGFVQQYQVDVDPNRLRSYGVPLSAVVSAVRGSNMNVGGNVLESNGAWLIVRGVGLIESIDDVKRIPVGASGGVPVYLEQIANVHVGDAFRVASLVKGRQEAVGGVVVARTGVNTKNVIDAVKARIAQIQPGLPPGVRIVPFYDRSDLIEQSVDTLRHALVEEILLVTLAHVIFLMHFRSILIVTIPLPLAVLMAFLGMYYAGVTSNIMSLAGIAIAIGVLVDAGIVVTENAFRFMEQRQVDPHDRAKVWSHRPRIDAAGGTSGVLLDGDHPLGVRPGLRVDRSGREALSSARLYEDVCGTRCDRHLGHARARLCSLLLGGTFRSEDDNPVMRGSTSALPACVGRCSESSRSDRQYRRRAVCRSTARCAGYRQRVHAAAERGRSDVHADRRPEHLVGGEHRDRQETKRRVDVLPRGGLRRGQGRPRRHVHRSRAAQHDGDDRSPEAKGTMASRHDARSPASRHGARCSVARSVEHLDDAHRQSDRHADDGDSVGGGRQDLRNGPDHARSVGAASRGRRPDRARRKQCLSRAGDQRAVPEHRGRSRRGRTIRRRSGRRPAGHRERRSARRS